MSAKTAMRILFIRGKREMKMFIKALMCMFHIKGHRWYSPYVLKVMEQDERNENMRIKMIEVEADAQELKASQTLSQNMARLLSQCFAPQTFYTNDNEQDDEEESEEHEVE